jgi:uncharacterized protein
MKDNERKVLTIFKSLLYKKINLYKLILFGSRSRGDADLDSDMDLMVIVEGNLSEEIREIISDCAWEAGFPDGIVIVPVIFSRHEWESSPQQYSLVVQAAERDGVFI